MLRNYLKIAWRNLIKNKVQTFINVFGLALGMAVVMLIGLWIYDELSFDKYFQNYDHIVQVMQHQTENGVVSTQNTVPIPLGEKLRQDYMDNFKYVVLSTNTEEHILAVGDKKLSRYGNFMQPEAPKLFSLKMLKGTPEGLADQSSILLSARLSRALFDNADPMGQIVRLDNKYNVKVTGVYEDLPRNTSFSGMSFLGAWDLYMTTYPNLKKYAAVEWGNNSWRIFAQLRKNADIAQVSARIKDLKMKGLAAANDKLGLSFKAALFLHPMSKWHLYSEFKDGINTGGGIEFVWMFGIIGLFVLLLACINFMNLSTARSEKRAKEVGIRKTLGSVRKQLIGQFFTESLLIASLALILSLAIVQFVFPWFNQVAGKNVHILWINPVFWIMLIGFTLFTGVIAGSYPAFYLSSFQPVKVLKGTFKAGRFAALPRKVLVVVQFTVSVILIIGTIIVFRQVQYTKNRPVGYSRHGLVQVMTRTPEIFNHFAAVRNELLQSGAVDEMTESGAPVTDTWSDNSDISWPGKDPKLQVDFGTIPVTAEYGKTIGWKVIEGRDLSRDYLSDSSATVVNEAAIKLMNLKNPIGQYIQWYRRLKIVGVVKDIVMGSPYDPVQPMLFHLLAEPGNFALIRISPKMSAHDALEKIAMVFKEYDPGSPFDYRFADAEYAAKFANEERVGKLAGFFTLLAIIISGMGLFGMASFTAEQRTKEIGVRKVLGATVLNLWKLMSADFVALVSISIIIAIPVAYYFMSNWLKNYKYNSGISWWIFGVTAAGALLLTLLTVSYQSIKSAMANPVKSLRSE